MAKRRKRVEDDYPLEPCEAWLRRYTRSDWLIARYEARPRAIKMPDVDMADLSQPMRQALAMWEKRKTEERIAKRAAAYERKRRYFEQMGWWPYGGP